MSQDERRGWMVVAALFVVEFFIAGPVISLFGVYFTPLMKYFGWTHAQVAQTATAYALIGGLSAPLVGWLIERIRVQWVMAVGALITGVSYLIASQSGGLALMVGMFAIVGIGNQAATTLPGTFVAATWFENRRGLSIGVMLVGMSLGMVIAPMLIEHVTLLYGWRWGMAAVGFPMMLVAVPVCLLFVRVRPAQTTRRAGAPDTANLPGLDLGPAMRSASFWLILSLEFFFFMTFGAIYFHIVPYLIHIGFKPQTAADIYGAQAALSAVGWVASGYLADRSSPKMVMEGALFLLALSVVGLLGARYNIAFIGLFLAFWAATVGVSATVVPLIIAETFGLRRYGSITGIIFLVRSIGIAVSPLVTGRLVDLTGGYALPFELAFAYIAFSAISTALVYPVAGHDLIPGQRPAGTARAPSGSGGMATGT